MAVCMMTRGKTGQVMMELDERRSDPLKGELQSLSQMLLENQLNKMQIRYQSRNPQGSDWSTSPRFKTYDELYMVL